MFLYFVSFEPTWRFFASYFLRKDNELLKHHFARIARALAAAEEVLLMLSQKRFIAALAK